MFGVLGEGRQHRIEGRILGLRAATRGLELLEHAAIVGVALQLFATLPPEIADKEEASPGEQAVRPILEIGAKLDARSRQIDTLRLFLHFDQTPVEEVVLGTFHEDEAHPIVAGIELTGIEELEVETAQANLIEDDEMRSPALGLDHGQPGFTSPRDDGFGMGSDRARDVHGAGNRLVDRLDIGARRLMPLTHQTQERPLALAQIAVAQMGQAVQIAEQPVPHFRLAAVAFPNDVDARHGFYNVSEKARTLSAGPRGRRHLEACLLYTSDAADDLLCVDLGGRRI